MNPRMFQSIFNLDFVSHVMNSYKVMENEKIISSEWNMSISLFLNKHTSFFFPSLC